MNELLESIRFLKESEDHIEFKEAKRNFEFNGGSHADPKSLQGSCRHQFL